MESVSKTYTYIPKNDYAVYYYKDSKLDAIQSHQHDFYEVLLFIDGDANYIVDNNIYHLEKGDLLFIPPGVFHNPIINSFDKPYERYVLWVSEFVMEKLFELDQDIETFKKEEYSKVFLLRSKGHSESSFYGLFKSLFKTYNEKEICYKIRGYSMIANILCIYNREIYNKSNNLDNKITNNLISEIIYYIDTNISEDLSLDKISSIFYINKYTISRKFKESMGISYYQYVIQKRLSIGKRLLQEGIPVSVAHKMCGFNDYTCFYRSFKKQYKFSPSKLDSTHNLNK